MNHADLFLGRQSILDRNQNLVAFELLFRSGHKNSAEVSDDVAASATVINHVLNEIGIETVLGKYRGFINLDASLLLSEVIELLPKKQVVLEILETVEINAEIVERCKQLKGMGYSLALDDFFCYGDEFKPLLELVDIVKVDVMQLDAAALAQLVRQLKNWPVKLLAEKVDTQEQVQRCLDLGFELFQGYYFARPVILSGKRLSHSELELMKLLGLVMSDAETGEIEKIFKQSAGLGLNLIRLTNSAATGARSKITSLTHAITVLGRRQLQRWLQLLLFMNQKPGADFPNPLLQLAATRGKLMELLAAERPRDGKDYGDRAFMVGIMSLMDALLGIPLAEVIKSLNVSEDVRAALLERGGELGNMLALIEALEREDFGAVETVLARLPYLTSQRVTVAEAEALRWANSIGAPA